MLVSYFYIFQQAVSIILFFNLVLISLGTIDQNRSDARSLDTAINPYQAPLFAALDRQENLQLQMTKAEEIIQNATLNQLPLSSTSSSSPSHSNMHHNISKLSPSIKSPLQGVVRLQDLPLYNSTTEGLLFNLEGISFIHHRASVNGITVHYVIGGKGDPIVLLHGWPQSWYEWRHIMPILVRNNYTVIVPDLRGLGDTSKPSTGYDGITTANDIYQLLARLGVNRSIIVGHDIGAQTAYSFAAIYPNNVTKLVLLDFVFPGTILEKAIDDPWWVGFHKVPNLPEAIIEGNEREYLSWFYRQLAYNPYSITEQDIDEYVRQYSAPGGMRSGFEYFKAFTTNAMVNNETSKLKLSIPVLAVSGEFSVLKEEKMMMIDNPTFVSAKKLAYNVTGVEVPFSDHWIPEEQPSFLAQLVINFINDKVQISSNNESESSKSVKSQLLTGITDNPSLSSNNYTGNLQTSNLSNVSLIGQTSLVMSENYSNAKTQELTHPVSISDNSTFQGKTDDNQTFDSNILSTYLSDVKVDENNTSRNTNLTTGSTTADKPITNSISGTNKIQTVNNNIEQKTTDNEEAPLSVALEAVKRIFDSEDED